MKKATMPEGGMASAEDEMPSPEPAPGVVHAEAVDVWTNKPFCTVSLHRKEHEVSLSRDEADDLVVRVFNTNSGDRFERIVNEEGIAQLVPAEMPPGVRSRQGFAQFLQQALEREAGSANPESAQITCESREGREDYTVEMALTLGSGMYAARYPVTLAIPLRNRATSGDKHLIALRTLSDKFSGEVKAQKEELMEEIEGLQQQLNLMRLQMNQRVFFGVNHSIHIASTKLVIGRADDPKDHPQILVERVDCTSTRHGGGTNFDTFNRDQQQCLNSMTWGLQDVAKASSVASGVQNRLFATDPKTAYLMPMPSAELQPLQLCRDLESITINEQGGLITDLDFLATLPKLAEVSISKPDIRDFEALTTLPAIRKLTLTGLVMPGGGEIDVSPLARITTLEEINFTGSPAIANVAPLAKIQTLTRLTVTDCRVTDRRAFAACEGLTVVPE